jgi:hypothetical protein
MNNKIITILCLFGWTSFTVQAQQIELRAIEFAKNKMVIHYDLVDSVEGRFYSIRLYSSADGFLNAVQKIIGDAGLEVKPGRDKKIEWALGEELGTSFEGKLAVEVRGRQFIPFISADNINAYKVFKRKRNYNLTWSGGTPQNILNFDLMRGDKKVMSFPNIANVGHHAFEFPAYVKPGRNYHFKISDSKNKEEEVKTNTFRIKRKVPLVVKALPAIALGALVYVIATNKSSGGEEPIADPILPENK